MHGLFAGQELLGHAHGIAGIAVVVARHDLERTPQHAATGVDLGDGELHALLVGLEERREYLVAVELAQPDRLAGGRKSRRGGRSQGGQGDDAGEAMNPVHDVSRRRWQHAHCPTVTDATDGRLAAVDRNMGIFCPARQARLCSGASGISIEPARPARDCRRR